eukprot:893588-Rhodomonas_salina.1
MSSRRWKTATRYSAQIKCNLLLSYDERLLLWYKVRWKGRRSGGHGTDLGVLRGPGGGGGRTCACGGDRGAAGAESGRVLGPVVLGVVLLGAQAAVPNQIHYFRSLAGYLPLGPAGVVLVRNQMRIKLESNHDASMARHDAAQQSLRLPVDHDTVTRTECLKLDQQTY